MAVSVSTLLCYYGIGLPLALLFGFKMEKSLRGFWAGYIVAMAVVDIVVIYLVVVAKWEAKYILKPKSASALEQMKTAEGGDLSENPKVSEVENDGEK